MNGINDLTLQQSQMGPSIRSTLEASLGDAAVPVVAPGTPEAAPTDIISSTRQSIRGGMEGQVATMLAAGDDPEESIARWDAATALAKQYSITPGVAFGMVDDLSKDYFTRAPALKTLPKALADSFQAAKLSNDLGIKLSKYLGFGSTFDIIGLSKRTDEESKALYAEAMAIKDQMKALQIDAMPKQWFRDWTKAFAGVIPYTADIVVSGAIAAGATALVGASGGMTSAPWFQAVKATVAATTRFARSAEIMRGLNFLEMTERGIPEYDARVWSNVSALGQAAIESVLGIEAGLGAAIGSQGIKSVTERVITRLGATNLMSSVAAKFAGRMVIGTASEILEEGGQSVIAGIATIIAQSMQDEGVVLNPVNSNQIITDAATSMFQAMITSPFLGLAGNVAMMFKDKKAALDLASMASAMSRTDFIDIASKSPVFEGLGVSDAEKADMAGKMHDRQAQLAIQAQQTASDISYAKAKAGESESDEYHIPRLPDGSIAMSQDSPGGMNPDGSRNVSFLAGDAEEGGTALADIETVVSASSVTITGADIDAKVAGTVSEIMSQIAAQNPGKELVLAPGVEDSVLIGAYERFMENGGSNQFSKEDTIADAKAELEISQKLDSVGVDKVVQKPAIALMKFLSKTLGVSLSDFGSPLGFKVVKAQSRNGQKVAGGFSIERAMDGSVNMATAMIHLMKTRSGNGDKLDTINHEVIHYFRAFASQNAKEVLEPLEKLYGVIGGEWNATSDERLVRDFEVWLRTQKAPSPEAATLFQRLGEFLRTLYRTISGTLNPDTRAVFDKWASAYMGDDIGKIEVASEEVGRMIDMVHPVISEQEDMERRTAKYIERDKAKFGKSEQYYKELVYRYTSNALAVARHMKTRGVIDQGRRTSIMSGSWVTNPQLVAEIKEATGVPLTNDEKDLLALARGQIFKEHKEEGPRPGELFSVDKTRKADEAFAYALKDVGKTMDPNEAGFILPDGTMLNFSGGKTGTRGMEHGNIEYPGNARDPNKRIADFIAMGAMRVDLQAGILELSNMPTSEQWRAYIKALGSTETGYAMVDMRDGSRHSEVMIQIDNKPTLGFVSRFYNGENVTSKSPANMLLNIDRMVDPDTDMLYATDQENDAQKYKDFERGVETDAKKYDSFEKWIASMFLAPELISEKDRAWYKAHYEYANSPAAASKRFPKKGDFAEFLAKPREFNEFIYQLVKAIYSKHRFLSPETETHSNRIEGAISKAPELRNLVDAMNKSGKSPSEQEHKKFLALARKKGNEALFKYLYALVQSDENLAHEALSDMKDVPLIVKRELTGNEDISIADQPMIIDALRSEAKDELSEELASKVEDGTITMAEIKKYLELKDAAHKEDIAEYAKSAKEESKANTRYVKDLAGKKMQDLKDRMAARNAAKKLKREMDRIMGIIFKRPSSRVAYFEAALVKAIQEAMIARKPIDKKSLPMSGSFAAKSQEWNDRLDAMIDIINAGTDKETDDMDFNTLGLIASMIQSITREGVQHLREQEIAWGENVKSKRYSIITELKAGKYWKTAVGSGSEEKKDREKKLNQMARFFDADRPDAFFRKYLGKNATELLFDRSVRARSAKFDNYDRRTKMVTDYIAEHKMMKNGKLLRKMTIKGILESDKDGNNGRDFTVTGSELVGLRALIGTKTEFNALQRDAVIFGNFFTGEEKDSDGTVRKDDKVKADEYLMGKYQEKLDTLLAFIDDNISTEEEALAKLMLGTMDNDADWHRFAGAMINLTNKEPVKEPFYFSMVRQGTFSDGEDETYDALKAAGYGSGLDDGMAIYRKRNISPSTQKPIKIDALQIYFSSIAKQEHLTEVGPYIKELNGVFKNGRYAESLRTGIKQSLGQKAMDYIDKQIDTLTNPTEFSEKASGGEMLTLVRGAMVVSNLSWRLSSVAMQMLTSPLPGYVEAPLEMLPASIEAYTNQKKFLAMVEAKSPFLRHRLLSIEASMMAKRKQLGLSTAIENIGEMGMRGLSWADRISVAIVWEAVSRKKQKAGMSEGAANDYADRFIIQTQPTSEEADRAPMYRNPDVFKQVVLQFTQPLNVIWNNIRHDIPQAAREEEYGKILRYITAYAMSGVAISAIAVLRGRGPEEPDEEKWARYWIHAGTSQFTDAIPFIGGIVTSLTGYAIVGDNNSWLRNDKNYPAFDLLAKSIEGLFKDEKDFKAIMLNAVKGMGMMSGAPIRAVEDYYKMISGALQ